MNETIPIDSLLRSRAAPLICYPRYCEEEAERRLKELRGLGVSAIELRGRHRIGELQILGKGHVGVVVAARTGDTLAALKIRRVDADRESFDQEAENLMIANSASAGPNLMRASLNFLLMELVEGPYLAEWIGGLNTSEVFRLRRAMRTLLDEARRLDAIGLDHGELSEAKRHVIVSGDVPRIIDFESASTKRRAANVTSIAHYIYFNGRMRSLVGRLSQLPDTSTLREALRRYKNTLDQRFYVELLRICNLDEWGAR